MHINVEINGFSILLNQPVRIDMQFNKQPIDIPVNVDSAWEPLVNKSRRKIQRRHSVLLPNSIRCIIAGPSNCGKTNLLINLIVSKHGLKFENIYVYSSTLWQPKYEYLRKLFQPQHNNNNYNGVEYREFTASDDVIEPKDAKPNSIIIFDDVICEKNQEIIRKYYSLGRHQSVDSFYLTTTYARIGKHLIRDNCNLVIFSQQNELNLRHIYNDMGVGCHMSFGQFQKFCFECWRERYGFAIIDMDSDLDQGRYRKGFAQYLILR